MDYYKKYLKYKKKYLDLVKEKKLQRHIGGIDCANFGLDGCDMIPGCTFKNYSCEQKKCINNNKINCKITRGCYYNNNINKCIPNCEKFNDKKKYSDIKVDNYPYPPNESYCNFVKECTFDKDKKKCMIRDTELRNKIK